ncbi:MAG: class I SAM-dependent methyltransferase [Pleurocapsa sp.]
MSNKQLTQKRDWNAYYDAVTNRPPRKTISTALAAFDKPGMAVDLGCGAGRDTVEIIRQNWTVLAIDREPDAITRLLARPNLNTLQLTTQIASFEEWELPKAIDLINASFCLPFCSPEAFPNLWNKIFNSLASGGRFSGHLFGNRDSWSSNELINTFTRSQVETLLQSYAIEMLEEEEHPGKTPLREDRDWHIFHIVARK